jgi:hypothetical protein
MIEQMIIGIVIAFATALFAGLKDYIIDKIKNHSQSQK